MAITYKGVHHRSPSGMHNKVKWILSECKWSYSKVCSLEIKMRASKDLYKSNLVKAFYIAKYILSSDYIKIRAPWEWLIGKKYHWLEQECINYAKRKKNDS